MEPTMNQIDDYNNNEPKEKKRLVVGIVLAIIIAASGLQMVKNYYDTHMPASFNPVIVK